MVKPVLTRSDLKQEASEARRRQLEQETEDALRRREEKTARLRAQRLAKEAQAPEGKPGKSR